MNDETHPKAGPESADAVATEATIARAEYVRRLLGIGTRHGEIPLYGSREWEQLDSTDPRRFASVVRAAECWFLDGTDDSIRKRITQELADNDMLARWRVRMAGHDIHGAVGDWGRVHEVVTARREYRERWEVSA